MGDCRDRRRPTAALRRLRGALQAVTAVLSSPKFASAKIRASPGFVGDARATLLPGLGSNNRARQATTLRRATQQVRRDKIEELAEDFLAGRAEVDPRDYPKTCERCGLQTSLPHSRRHRSQHWHTKTGSKTTEEQMSKSDSRQFAPPDQPARAGPRSGRSILVQAPAGSGKTDLLTRRFLAPACAGGRTEPDRRHHLHQGRRRRDASPHFSELEKAAATECKCDLPSPNDEFSMQRSPGVHSRSTPADGSCSIPAQLRISTIDSFCHELALQQPLLSGLGGGLDIAERPADLYRRAARRTIEQIGRPGSPLGARRISAHMARQQMAGNRRPARRNALQARPLDAGICARPRDPRRTGTYCAPRLERPFAAPSRGASTHVSLLLDEVPGARRGSSDSGAIRLLATQRQLHAHSLNWPSFPNAPFLTPDALEEAHQALSLPGRNCCSPRRRFPPAHDKNQVSHGPRRKKPGFSNLIAVSMPSRTRIRARTPSALCRPPVTPEDDWQIVRACFTLLRRAAAELKVVFAEAGAVDYTEVAQIA